ncbi:hypothetical protein ACVWW2_000748 [Bradyrhizobium sp. LM4.3]
MVDLFSMFRRRPAKRGRPGFARQDITALGDSIGGLVASPVRDAPPIARDQPMHAPDQFQADFQATYQAEPRAQAGSSRQGRRRQAQWFRRASAVEAAGLPGCA